MSGSLILRGGLILTMNDARAVVQGDVWIRDGRVVAIGRLPADARADTTIEASGAIVMPGLIQTHIHLCQTLFRSLGDDRPLLAWLRSKIWPLEAAHDDLTLRAATRLAAGELQLGGTTTVLTMETVHGTDAVFDALVATGLRAVVGKCLMDVGGDAPARLVQTAAEGLDESLALYRRWHAAANGRLGAALAPRFAVSCTRDLLESTAASSAAHNLIVHTHASEQQDEVALVRARTGHDNIAYLDSVGLATPRLCAAHCVWATDAEQAILAERRVHVLHCPGSNLKLGSGIAPIVEMRARGIGVSLGADGAACNNTLDMFHEMRLAATLQAMRRGPGVLPAADVVWMATREGARALGLEADIGSIAVGKKADIIVVGTRGLHQVPSSDPYATLVYATRADDVIATIIDGQVVARNHSLTWADRAELGETGRHAAATLRARAGV